MKRIMIVVLLTLCAGLMFAQGFTISTPEGNVSMSITGVQADGKTTSGNIIDQIVVKLEALQRDYHSKLNKVDQKRANGMVDEIYNLLAMLPDDANITVSHTSSTTTSTSTSSTSSTNPNININISGMQVEEKPVVKEKPVVQQTQPVKPTVEVKPAGGMKSISESEFAILLDRIGKESFRDDKLRVLKTASKSYRFNVNQIVRLINAYTFSDDKIEVLQISYPACIDPQNNYKILDAFTYSSDKEAAEEIINSN